MMKQVPKGLVTAAKHDDGDEQVKRKRKRSEGAGAEARKSIGHGAPTGIAAPPFLYDAVYPPAVTPAMHAPGAPGLPLLAASIVQTGGRINELKLKTEEEEDAMPYELKLKTAAEEEEEKKDEQQQHQQQMKMQPQGDARVLELTAEGAEAGGARELGVRVWSDEGEELWSDESESPVYESDSLIWSDESESFETSPLDERSSSLHDPFC